MFLNAKQKLSQGIKLCCNKKYKKGLSAKPRAGAPAPAPPLRRVFEVASQQGKNSAGPWVFLLNPPLQIEWSISHPFFPIFFANVHLLDTLNCGL